MLTHKGTVTIETPRLLLRRLTPDDAPAMYRNWACDPEVTKYLTWPPHSSAEATRALLTDWEKSYTDDTYYQWAIVLKSLGEPIGSICAVHLNEDVASAEIGYCIGTAWWHQGIMSEALKAVMDFSVRRSGYEPDRSPPRPQ